MRRGSDHADIYSIAFDTVSHYIACSSDKGTIHIFQIRPDVSLASQTNKQMEELRAVQAEGGAVATDKAGDDKSTNNTRSMLSFMKGVLPSYFDSEWSFAQFRIVDSHAVCAIKDNKIISISNDGNYYLAEIDPKAGGECKKL